MKGDTAEDLRRIIPEDIDDTADVRRVLLDRRVRKSHNRANKRRKDVTAIGWARLQRRHRIIGIIFFPYPLQARVKARSLHKSVAELGKRLKRPSLLQRADRRHEIIVIHREIKKRCRLTIAAADPEKRRRHPKRSRHFTAFGKPLQK